MIPVTQTKVVVTNSKGEKVVNGNCFAACIASLLELPITEVPNVEVFFHMETGYWQDVMDTFLESKGYELASGHQFQCFHFPDLDIPDREKLMEELKDQYYLVYGDSPRGVYHSTIWQNGVMVHDPHPSRDGILNLGDFKYLRKI